MALTLAANKQPADRKRLGAMLLIALVLAIWVLLKDDTEDADTIELTSDAPTQSAVASRDALNAVKKSAPVSRLSANDNSTIPWQKLQRQPINHSINNVFKVHSWLVVPKVAKTKPPPAPPPMAPAAPFTYIGKLEDSPKGTQLFLMRGGKLYTAIKGQKIDAQWRLDSEENDTINLTYLPLNLPQVLAKSAKSMDIAAPVSAETNL